MTDPDFSETFVYIRQYYLPENYFWYPDLFDDRVLLILIIVLETSLEILEILLII